jgi:alpha-glucosidase (family GH31 glycosyl hydrolase)
MQSYAAFLWSGDVYSTWETLRTHIPIAINAGLRALLTGVPDIGGFVPTPEFTTELYLRWFSIWRVLHAVPHPRAHLETPASLGLEQGRARAHRNRQLYRRRLAAAG